MISTVPFLYKAHCWVTWVWCKVTPLPLQSRSVVVICRPHQYLVLLTLGVERGKW